MRTPQKSAAQREKEEEIKILSRVTRRMYERYDASQEGGKDFGLDARTYAALRPVQCILYFRAWNRMRALYSTFHS